MLSSTISKIRKVCTIAFQPRPLRATWKTTQKFEKFSYGAVCNTQIRPKSDTQDQDNSHQPKRIVEFSFSKKKSPRRRLERFENIEDDKTAIINHKPPDLAKIITPQVTTKPETECEKCERLIAQVFGPDKDTTPTENIENVNRLQEIHLQSTKKDDKDTEDVGNTDFDKRDKRGQSTGTTESVNMPSKILENIAQVNMADDKNATKQFNDPEVHSSVVYNEVKEPNKDVDISTLQMTNIMKEGEDKLAQKLEQIEDTPIAEVHKPEVEGFNVTPKALEDNATLNIVNKGPKDNLNDMTPQELEDARLDEIASRCINAPDDKIDEMLLREISNRRTSYVEQNSSVPLYDDDFVKMDMIREERNVIDNSNLDDQDDEKPADFNILQRLYPTFDGFPSEKDLKLEDTSSPTLTPERIYTDEKPLHSPEDEALLYENAERRAKRAEENIVTQETMIEAEPEAEVTNTVIEEVVEPEPDIETETDTDRPVIYPNQVLIDPYGKRSLTYESEDYDTDTTSNARDEIMQQMQTKNLEEEEIPENKPRNEGFDPKYVVTCNETCPISADGLTSISVDKEASILKGAEAIYDDLTSANLKNHTLKQVALEDNAYDTPVAKPEIETAETAETVEEANTEVSGKENISPVENMIEEADNSEDISILPNSEPTVAPEKEKTDFKTEEATLSSIASTTVDKEPWKQTANDSYIRLPSLNDEQASLSELLKRVRERNRLEYCKAVDFGASAVEQLGSQAALVDPAVSQVPKKPPPCPPPRCPQIRDKETKKPSPCPPPKAPESKPCAPKKNPCEKFKKWCGLGLANIISMFPKPQMFPQLPLAITTINFQEVIDDANEATMKAVLTDEVIFKLQTLGDILYYAVKLKAQCNFEKTSRRERFVVKDFEPWTPIPSWPLPKKEVRRPLVCPKEGCKLLPPPKLSPPCQQNPCINFPKRNFAFVDFLFLNYNETKLYNVEEM